jgi:hypothetical protein
MSKRGTAIFIAILLLAGIGFAAVLLWVRASDRSLSGYYTVTDSFVDSTGDAVASVGFVRVQQYDSLRMLRVAELLTREAIEQHKVNREREREFLYHFFQSGDTASLTAEIVDELAYTHPGVPDPAAKLLMVPGGWVVRATFAPRLIQPRTVVAQRSEFYMPRPGVRAKDLR